MGIVEVVILVVVVVGIVIAFFGLDRYRGDRNNVDSAAEPTDEVFDDPQTGQRMRVWYDAKTGKREYRPAE